MIPMTTARTVAPNLGGRANNRSRAEVASYYLSWTAVPHSDCRPLTGGVSPGVAGPFISTRTSKMSMSCRRRSSGGNRMNSRAAALQAATRFASFHSARPVTPGGSLRLRGCAIGIA